MLQNLFLKKYKIIILKGGFGNQLYQIMIGMYLKDLGFKIIFDDSSYKKDSQRSNIVKNFFSTEYFLSLENILYLVFRGNAYSIFSCFNEKNILLGDNFLNEIDKNVIYNGYFQNRIYANKIYKKVKRKLQFIFKSDFNFDESQCLVHVRRGDYVNHPYIILPSFDYYKKSIFYMYNNFGIKTFHFISDDIEYCSTVFNEKDFPLNLNFIFVKNESDIHDFKYGLKFSNFINSNSSFSNMFSWLSDKNNKNIIFPEYWIKNEKSLQWVLSDEAIYI